MAATGGVVGVSGKEGQAFMRHGCAVYDRSTARCVVPHGQLVCTYALQGEVTFCVAVQDNGKDVVVDFPASRYGLVTLGQEGWLW